MESCWGKSLVGINICWDGEPGTKISWEDDARWLWYLDHGRFLCHTSPSGLAAGWSRCETTPECRGARITPETLWTWQRKQSTEKPRLWALGECQFWGDSSSWAMFTGLTTTQRPEVIGKAQKTQLDSSKTHGKPLLWHQMSNWCSTWPARREILFLETNAFFGSHTKRKTSNNHSTVETLGEVYRRSG